MQKGERFLLNNNSELINNFKKICICRSIKGGTIMTAIREGSLSFEALRRKIRVGTGNCKAKRCRAKIETMVKDYKVTRNHTPVEPEASFESGLNTSCLKDPLRLFPPEN